jgi:hypothetical protein
MNRILLVSVTLLAKLLFDGRHIQGISTTNTLQEPAQHSPVVLCIPGVYLSDPGDCVPGGPSDYLTRLAQQGIRLPLLPLPAAPTNPDLSRLDVSYGEVVTPDAPVYGSLEDAQAKKKKTAVQRLSGDFIYISYNYAEEIGGGRFYMIGPGAWMTAADVSRIGVLPYSRGIAFSQTPRQAFGWILTYFSPSPQLETKRTPGSESGDYTGHLLNLYDVVPIFSEQLIGEETWYMVAPDEWVLGKYIARVTPTLSPPAGVNNDRWIEVNLYEQTLAVYEARQLVFATIIASGADPFWTRPGLFQISEKLEKTDMHGSFEVDRSDAYYLQDVPWTMYFDQARALHGAYWRAKMGFSQSHGCVNLTVGDAHWLFDWTQVGDWVYVWDPSGITPVDPDLYGPGGF